MYKHSDGPARERVASLNAATLRGADTSALHGLLATELLRLEQESSPGSDWRVRRERVRWCQLLAGEIRRRGEQLRLG